MTTASSAVGRRSYQCLTRLALAMIAVALLWSANNTAECCDNSTAAAADAATLSRAFHHPSISSCVTEIIRAICGALRPSPIKRNTELINSILGLPRVLQNAGR